MKIKVSTILKNVYGEPLQSGRKKPKKDEKDKDEYFDLTLKEIMVNSLLTEFPEDKKLPGEDKLRRYRLAIKIQEAQGEIDLTTEQVAETKALIAKCYSPLAAGQAWELIEK